MSGLMLELSYIMVLTLLINVYSMDVYTVTEASVAVWGDQLLGRD